MTSTTELTLLVWTDHFLDPAFLRSRRVTTGTGLGVDLTITADRSVLDDADAVWFHGPSVTDLPARTPGQPWVLMSMESEVNYPITANPGGQFDITMTYRLDSDVPVPYANRHEYDDFAGPVPERQGPSRGALACYLASAPRPERDGYVRELMRQVEIDSLGACLNNRDIEDVAGPGQPGDVAQTRNAIQAYKFFLAFENSVAVYYVTEKLYRPLAWGTVPVYLGAPNVRELSPAPESVIVTDDFDSPRDLGRHLTELDNDDDAYRRHLQWRDHALDDRFRALVDVGSIDPMARLATKLIHGCDRSCDCGGRLRPPPVPT